MAQEPPKSEYNRELLSGLRPKSENIENYQAELPRPTDAEPRRTPPLSPRALRVPERQTLRLLTFQRHTSGAPPYSMLKHLNLSNTAKRQAEACAAGFTVLDTEWPRYCSQL